MVDYSERVREYRRRWGLTQDDLAERLRVSVRSVRRWEAGDSEPMRVFLELMGMSPRGEVK